ncbi:hypothetical protein L7F22_024471 [Adiantum nelumboides]|nr:hypothetical protein [Adiantum nelumboides]
MEQRSTAAMLRLQHVQGRGSAEREPQLAAAGGSVSGGAGPAGGGVQRGAMRPPDHPKPAIHRRLHPAPLHCLSGS